MTAVFGGCFPADTIAVAAAAAAVRVVVRAMIAGSFASDSCFCQMLAGPFPAQICQKVCPDQLAPYLGLGLVLCHFLGTNPISADAAQAKSAASPARRVAAVVGRCRMVADQRWSSCDADLDYQLKKQGLELYIGLFLLSLNMLGADSSIRFDS